MAWLIVTYSLGYCDCVALAAPITEVTFYRDENYTVEIRDTEDFEVGEYIYVHVDGNGRFAGDPTITWMCNNDTRDTGTSMHSLLVELLLS